MCNIFNRPTIIINIKMNRIHVYSRIANTSSGYPLQMKDYNICINYLY